MPVPARKGSAGDDLPDDYYTIYAWDVVDGLFATIVASLPALNCVIEASIVRMRILGSHSRSFLRAKIRTLGGSSQDSQTDKLVMSNEGNQSPAIYSVGLRKLDSSDQVSGEEWTYEQDADVELQRPVSTFRERLKS